MYLLAVAYLYLLAGAKCISWLWLQIFIGCSSHVFIGCSINLFAGFAITGQGYRPAMEKGAPPDAEWVCLSGFK